MKSPVEYGHVLEPLFERARTEPGGPCLELVYSDRAADVLDVAGLCGEVSATSQALRASGLRPGESVILCLSHSRELVISFLAAMHAGAIPIVHSSYVDPAADVAPHISRLLAVADNAEARAVMAWPGHRDCLRRELGPRPIVVLSADAIRGGDVSAALAPPIDGGKAFFQYTSGSTGAPKGVAQTHARVLRSAAAQRRCAMTTENDVVVSWLPLYHDLGLVSGLLTPIILGAPTTLLSPHHWVRRPGIYLRCISERRATVTFMPNFGLNQCARATRDADLEGVDLSSLQAMSHGAETVRHESHRAFVERFAPYGFRAESLRAGYGMAELVVAATMAPRQVAPTVDWVDARALREDRRAVPRPAGSPGAMAVVGCGTPLPGTEVRIAREDGGPAGDREIGEILVRSDYMFEGYHRRPDLDRELLRDGWLHPGDRGYLCDGQLFPTGRVSDTIIVGGRNIAPDDVELIADEVEGVRPGRSVAFALPDASGGTESVAIVCETVETVDRDRALAIERELRRRVVGELDVALGVVHLVERGWIVKTSSGKKARRHNRDKYLAETNHDDGKR
jgi:acyl-CoA synthetase (AMP-forming)/AMP-acid ligase II